MANTSISLTSLDFDTLKTNFQSYLTNQSIFKDYNFEGSNMNVLLDVMSYNTYLNSFYLNMVASEMFMDSAQKLDSVVSHAKELNYIPKSAKSPTASVTFQVQTTQSPLTISKSTTFNGQNSNGAFTFTTAYNQNFTSANVDVLTSKITYDVALDIQEGFFLQDSYVMDYTQPTQRFIISNPNIDIDSLTVTVIISGVSNVFKRVETLFNLNKYSNVFFLQAAQNNQYEVVFGDGLLGRIPNNLSTIIIDYRVTNGSSALGISSFLLTSPIGGVSSIVSTIKTTSAATNGGDAETIESIRKLAPRYFATQQRAVASDDYQSLILDKFQGQIEAVNVYGGEQLTPKQYGRVAVCLKPSGGTIAANYVKDQVVLYLQDFIALPTRVITTDPDYMYINIESEVQYNVTGTTKTASTIKTLLNDTIKQFSAIHLETFEGDFRYSKFVAHIDEADTSITSNNTRVNLIKRITPLINYPTSFVLDYNNPSELEGINESAGYTKGGRFYDEPIVTSSAFTYVSADGTEYPNCFIRDDNYGVLVVYWFVNNKFVVINNAIGSVDYMKGVVTITNFVTSSYGNYININITPKNKDIIVSRDKILIIDLVDVTINVIPTQK